MIKIDEVDFYLKDLESRFKYLDNKKYYLSYSGGKDSHFPVSYTHLDVYKRQGLFFIVFNFIIN